MVIWTMIHGWRSRLVAAMLTLVSINLDPATTDAADAEPAPNSIRSSLGRGSFPWYDPRTDQIRPLKLPKPPDQKLPNLSQFGSTWGWGDYLVFACFTAALVGLIIVVVRSWKRFEPIADLTRPADRPDRGAQMVEELPVGLRGAEATDDPWAEANRRRLAGDFAGAVLCLFVFQLLTLARLNLVRLAPGRTGRQLHRAVTDPELQTLITPTLRQFEAVYYGHQTPTAGDFAPVWEAAEAFQRRTTAQVLG